MTNNASCQFRVYEKSQIEHALLGLLTATLTWNQSRSKLDSQQIVAGNEIADCIDVVTSRI